MNRKKKILRKCPICGSALEHNELMQYTNVYRIKRNGEISLKRSRKLDNGSMECFFITCSNKECNFLTDCDLTSLNHKNIVIEIYKDKYYYEILEEDD